MVVSKNRDVASQLFKRIKSRFSSSESGLLRRKGALIASVLNVFPTHDVSFHPLVKQFKTLIPTDDPKP